MQVRVPVQAKRGREEEERSFAGRKIRLTIGMAAFWTFFYSSPHSTWAFGDDARLTAQFVVVMCCSMATCGVIFGQLDRARLARGGRKIVLAITGACAITTVIFSAAFNANARGPELPALVAAVLIGAYVACLGVEWAQAWDAELAHGRDIAVPLTASMFACALFMSVASRIVCGVIGDVSPCVFGMLALSAVLCPTTNPPDGATWEKSNHNGMEASISRDTARIVSVHAQNLRPLLMVGIVSLYAIVCGAMRSVYALGNAPFGQLEGFAHTILLAAFLLFSIFYSWKCSQRGRNNRFPWLPYVLTCVVALYITVLFTGTAPYVSNEVLLPTRPIATLYIFGALVADVPQERGRTGFWAGCVALPLLAINRMSSSISWLLWHGEGTTELLDALALALALVLTLGIIVYLMVPRLVPEAGGQAGEAMPSLSDIAPESPSFTTNAGMALYLDTARLTELSERYALSERESQVLILLAEGNSRARIAEVLVLSVNSVQTYARSLYRKMGVHSRQELIDMVRGDPRRDASINE